MVARRATHVIGCCLGLVLFAAGCTRTPPEPLRIGHLADFSGPEKTRGAHQRRGIQLALMEALPELEKDLRRKVLFLHVDCRSKGDVLQAEAVRLITLNRVAALVVDCEPAEAEKLARTTQAYDVPVILTGTAAPRANSIALGLGGSARGRALARYFLEQRKASSAVVLTPRQGGAPVPDLMEAFESVWRQGKGTSLSEWSWEAEGKVAEIAGRVRSGKPGAVMVTAGLNGFRAARSALDAAGVQAPLLFGGRDTSPNSLREAPVPAGGLYLATAYAAEGLTERGREVARRYRDEFKDDLDLYAAQGYDAASFIVEGLRRRSRATERTTLAKELEKIDVFETLTGQLTISAGVVRRPGFLVEVKESAAPMLRAFGSESD